MAGIATIPGFSALSGESSTDIVVSEDSDIEERIEWLDNEWKTDWTYFSSNESMESPHVDGSFKGLNLEEDVLRKIYYTNAINWYPGMFN